MIPPIPEQDHGRVAHRLVELLNAGRQVTIKTDDKPSGSIRIYVYSRKGSATLDMDAKDEGFETLNVGLENMVRELGATLVEKEPE